MSPLLRDALEGRYLRVGVGLVIAVALAVNALAGLGTDSTGETNRPAQIVAGASERAEEPGLSPTGEATAGTAGEPTATAEVALPPASGLPTAPVSTEPPTPTAAPTAGPARTPVVLEGSGSAVTAPFDYPGGTVRVLSRVTAASGGCTYIGTFRSTDPANLPSDPSLRTAVIFLEGSGTGEGWVDLGLPIGRYFVEVESDCTWVVTVSPT